ncbi:MAG: tRNA pseudouridine(38-40) synthase TruA [Deltaproteobacteria bacterium]|nr:tRNA pseudouridine(38-40) synthase TruA [Deltaproteobacteria bacterium]
MNVRLTLEYDGTEYRGWQVQSGGTTVQGVLEEALAVLLKRKVRVRGSGRTDAGVHALGQVADFKCPDGRDLARLQRSLNALIPDDITVKAVEEAAPSFDARRDATKRVYEYRLWNHPWRSVFNDRYSSHVARPLRVDAMREALAALEGEHDFSCFRAAGCGAATAVRRIYRNELYPWEDHWVYRIEATGYLRHMVRNIVGTLVQMGLGERDPGAFPALIRGRDRTLAGPTAPARGLFLVEVSYGPSQSPRPDSAP